MIDLSPLDSAPRMLLKAPLRPIQGERFQPTGFPDLGAATFKGSDGTEMLLVESAQSTANRMEAVCWDEARNEPVPALEGLPYVKVLIEENGETVATTASMLEAHRLNSPYVLGAMVAGETFESQFLKKAGFRKGKPIDRRAFIDTVFHFDPASLLHGIFLSNVEDGRMRLARVLSGFIEARNVQSAASGGVKNDRVNPSGDTAKGFGNVPFARTEFTASEVVAYFNVDLQQLRGWGLAPEANRLLQLLALWKIVHFLDRGLRLRTACDFIADAPTAMSPAAFPLPAKDQLDGELRKAIASCARLFPKPPATEGRFQVTAESGKVSRKSAAREKEKEKP